MRKRTSFIRFIQFWGVVIIIMTGGSIVALDTVGSYRDFNFRADQMRADHISRQKQIIRREVDRVVDMINHKMAQSLALTKTQIKARVYEACAIAQNIYQQNKTTRREAEIQQLILDALRPVRFENGSGYYFATPLDTPEMVFANKRDIEEFNLRTLPKARSQQVLEDMIEIARQSGEGFYEYRWAKPAAAGNGYKKISYVKRFEPYNWLIGTGLYVADVEAQIKTDLLASISRIRFGKEGYLFVNRFNGDTLVSNGKIFSGTQKLWEVFDKNPEQMKTVFEKEYLAALKPEGDYIYYSHVKLTDPAKESPKASFICGIPDLQWLVGAGVYLDDVETEIVRMHTELNLQTRLKMLWFIVIGVCIVALFLILLNWLTRRLKADFSLFVSFFNRAAHSDEPIDRNGIQFIELDRMAETANRMLRDKVRARQALMEERERLFVTIRSIGDGVITTDLSGRVELMNRVAEHLTGWKAAAARGKPLVDVFSIVAADTQETAENPVRQVLESGKTVGLADHTVLLSQNGARYQIADSAAPIKDADGNTTGVVLVFRDVTREYRMQEDLRQSEKSRRKAEEELRKMEKLRSVGTLAGGIAHDFNNILMVLFGNISIAKSSLSEDHPSRRPLEEAENSMNRAVGLTKQLLIFAKGGQPVRQNFSLDTLVEDTVRFDLSGSNVMPVFHPADDLWPARADRGQLQQVFSNLTVNARQAMPDGGRLYVTLENATVSNEKPPHLEQGKYIKVTVRDEGIGVEPKYLDRIFDPYFSTKQTGSGLGLATTYSIITKHGGHIGVDSTPGVGTTFTLYLPASESHPLAEAGQPADADAAPGHAARVLVMDDEESICDVTSQMLVKSGYSVETAPDGKETLRRYKQAMLSGDPFDLVIMDLTIPGGIGGKEAVRDVLALHPDARVIVSSGYANDPVMANHTAYGFCGIVEKPYTRKKLLAVLQRVLEK